MPAHDTQHYVPRFYFRLFSGGLRYISLLERSTGAVHHRASIATQCARHKYYRTPDLEVELGRIETRHAELLRTIIGYAAIEKPPSLSEAEHAALCEAIVFQRNRTPHAAQMIDSQAGHLLKQLEPDIGPNSSPDMQRILAGLQAHDRLSHSLLIAISIAFQLYPALADLRVYYLVNCTTLPFIFGDAPVVFYNQFLWYVRHHGTLGLQSPGLQVFYPVDQRTLVMLIDDGAYSIRVARGARKIHVTERTDVTQLNLLQMYQAQSAVYFAVEDAAEYLQHLWRAHHRRFVQTSCTMAIHKAGDLLLRGVPNTNEILQFHEPQLPIPLRLSFLDTTPLPSGHYRFSVRSPELHRALRARSPRHRADSDP